MSSLPGRPRESSSGAHPGPWPSMYSDGPVVDVLLFVEHRDRELEVVASIAQLLRERHGLSVAIASTLFDALLSAVSVRPRVVVSTGIAPARSASH